MNEKTAAVIKGIIAECQRINEGKRKGKNGAGFSRR